ncbi:urease accessory protein UreD [Paracoccus albus]|uniref:urease accessory protein UreD n=1 Tax=Paracoccus albus TaxID=3017784 RepID=UPI0022F115EC|nr:urease accessory protein UreD [Paracoccus albus]WBU59866.1 urease accessory protein UreD [Paracoccus albus]
MFDAAIMQRSFGAAKVALDRGTLTELSQSGSAKVMLPRTYGAAPELVFLNTSGGLTAGDRLEYSVTLGPDTRAIATTQTAERAYRADGEPAQATVSLHVASGGRLDWLPQDTILFDGSSFARRTDIRLCGDAVFLGLETMVLGRQAMGETVREIFLRDSRKVTRDGQVEVFDPLRLDSVAINRAGSPALLSNARAFSVLIYSGPDADRHLQDLRASLDEPGVEAAVSALPGRMILRACAADAWPLRRQIVRLIAILRPGGMPRVWQSQE